MPRPNKGARAQPSSNSSVNQSSSTAPKCPQFTKSKQSSPPQGPSPADEPPPDELSLEELSLDATEPFPPGLFRVPIPDVVFAAMALAGEHIFQILTKRPERMAEYMEREGLSERWAEAASERFSRSLNFTEPLENVWLGTSVEDQQVTDRIDDLRSITAAVRFLSLEPLLGPLPDLGLEGIDWVIVGGESGNQARPMKEEWVRDIRDQCQEADVPFFFKQWGGRHSKEGGRELDNEEWNQMPQGVDTVPA